MGGGRGGMALRPSSKYAPVVELKFAELLCFTFLRNSDVDQSTQLN